MSRFDREVDSILKGYGSTRRKIIIVYSCVLAILAGISVGFTIIGQYIPALLFVAQILTVVLLCSMHISRLKDQFVLRLYSALYREIFRGIEEFKYEDNQKTDNNRSTKS